MDTIYTNDMFYSTSLLKDIHQNMQPGFLKGWNDANDAMCLMSRETGIMTWGGRQWREGSASLPMSEPEFSDQNTLTTSIKVGLQGLLWEMNNDDTKLSSASSEGSNMSHSSDFSSYGAESWVPGFPFDSDINLPGRKVVRCV